MRNTIFRYSFLVLCLAVLMSAASIAASAQTASSAPELSVAGFRLGGDEKAAEELLKGYAPRYEGENAQPKYYFYNEYGNQVMTLTGYSKERPHLIVAIEVFGVGESYRNKHYQMKGRTAFMSESGFFIGARPSATSLMFAIPNVTGPKEVIKKKGMPEADEKSAKVRTLRYQLKAVRELEDRENKLKNVNFANYSAEYRFYKNKLSRFSIKVNTPAQNTAAL